MNTEVDMYHISDIKRFLRCERLYFYGKDENSVFKPYLRADANTVDLLKELFDITECYEGVRNDPADRVLSELNNFEWFIHPRFMDGQMRLNVPLMHKKGDLFDLYFVYYGTFVKDVDALTYRITLKVLKRHGLKVDRIYLIHLNGDYVNEGKLEAKKLFVIEDRFKKKKLIDIASEVDVDYEGYISQMESFDPANSKAKKCRSCKLYGLCEYYGRCFPEEKEEEDDSILTLVASRNKNRMYDQGIRQLKQADPSLVEGSRIQYAQIMASKTAVCSSTAMH